MSRRRRILLALAAWPVVGSLVVVYGRGSVGHIALLAVATLAAVGCWTVGCLIFLLTGERPSKWERLGWVALSLGSLLIGLWITLPFGVMLSQRDIAEARAFCEGLIPTIEGFRAETGRYPENPPVIAEGVVRPRLINSASFYQAGAGGYGFHFADPSGVLSGFGYSSRTGRWYEQTVFDLSDVRAGGANEAGGSSPASNRPPLGGVAPVSGHARRE